jgi:peptidyl-prolyl cis-trans isomerase A (cyclophilin A)
MEMRKRIRFQVGFCFLLLFIAGCDLTSNARKQEKEQIQNYISALGDTVYVSKPSGLYYIELKAGTGRTPVVKDTITFWYTGMFLNRTVFDSNISKLVPNTAIVGINDITYGQLLEGLDEGVQYMKEGGKARLLLPSGLAFGTAGYTVPDGQGNYYQIIPGYTPVLYEIELISVKAGPGK